MAATIVPFAQFLEIRQRRLQVVAALQSPPLTIDPGPATDQRREARAVAVKCPEDHLAGTCALKPSEKP